MFAFVWLPRDELTTRRRVAIGEMIEQAAEGRITNWSVDLGDGDLALVRYTLNVDAKTADARRRRARPPARRDGARLGAERRGGAGRAGRRGARDPARAHLSRPVPRRLSRSAPTPRTRPRTSSASPASRAPGARDVRLFRRDSDAPDRLRLKTYRLGEIIPLVRSGAGVREFRLPGARGGADPGRPRRRDRLYPRFRPADAGRRRRRAGAEARPSWSSAAIADVLEGKAENDPFNQLIVVGRARAARGRACSAPGSAICARPASPIR